MIAIPPLLKLRIPFVCLFLMRAGIRSNITTVTKVCNTLGGAKAHHQRLGIMLITTTIIIITASHTVHQYKLI